jgi:hypothetical protein
MHYEVQIYLRVKHWNWSVKKVCCSCQIVHLDAECASIIRNLHVHIECVWIQIATWIFKFQKCSLFDVIVLEYVRDVLKCTVYWHVCVEWASSVYGGWTIKEACFDSWQGQVVFFISKASKLTRGCTHYLTDWVPRLFLQSNVARTGSWPLNLHLVLKSSMLEGIFPLPFVPSCVVLRLAQENFSFTFYLIL